MRGTRAGMNGRRREEHLTGSGKGHGLVRVGFETVDNVLITPHPVSQHPVHLAPYVDVAIVAPRHHVRVLLPQEAHPLHRLVVPVACAAMQ